MNDDLDRVKQFVGMRLHGNSGELQQFICAVHWVRTTLPNLMKVEAPLGNLLEECLRHMSRTKKVATGCAILDRE